MRERGQGEVYSEEENALLERVRQKFEGSKSGGLDREMVKIIEHSDIFYLTTDFGVASFAPREWLTKCVWKLLDENTMIVGFEDTKGDNFPIGAGKKYARASATAFWTYKRLNEENGLPQTKVTYYQQADLRVSYQNLWPMQGSLTP